MWNVFVMEPGQAPIKLNDQPYTPAQVAMLLLTMPRASLLLVPCELLIVE